MSMDERVRDRIGRVMTLARRKAETSIRPVTAAARTATICCSRVIEAKASSRSIWATRAMVVFPSLMGR